MDYLKNIFFIFSVALFALALAMCTSPLMFVNVPSIILMVGIPFPIMISRHGSNAFKFYKEKGFKRNQMIDQWTRIIYASATASFIVGVVDMLANMKDPKAIGPALAISLLTVFYAAVMKLFFLEPFRDVEVQK